MLKSLIRWRTQGRQKPPNGGRKDKPLIRKHIATVFITAGVIMVIGSIGACEAETYSLLQGTGCAVIGFVLVHAGSKIGRWKD